VNGRYSRQERFAPLGADGQARLEQGCVLVVGVGALGTHAAEMLARAGVRRLMLVDRDVVEPSNLQRQVLFTESDAAQRLPKAVAARARLLQIRRDDLTVDAWPDDFDVATFEGLPERPDVLIDGTDNHATRYLINDLAVREGIAWIYGGAVGSAGTGAVVLPGRTPCLRCLLPEGPAAGTVGSCETAGILGPTVAVTAAFQVGEAIKLLAGREDLVTRGVFQHDLWQGAARFSLQDAERRPDCAACGADATFPALHRDPMDTATLCGRDAVQVHPRPGAECRLDRLATILDGAVAELQSTPHLLRFAADGVRFTVFPGGRALLFGLSDTARARALYDRWIGGG